MRREYLGDSYDAVKFMWQSIFLPWAPLYADPKFLSEDVQAEFKALTKIPVLNGNPPSAYSILNDPDTGIRSPDSANQREGRTHLSLPRIKDQLSRPNVHCVITFDQSNHRKANFPAVDQRTAKLQWLMREGLFAFYYVSHAPFLFAFSTKEAMMQAESLLARAGIPKNRLEHCHDTQRAAAYDARNAHA